MPGPKNYTIPPGTVPRPEDNTYAGGFVFMSPSSGKEYVISYVRAGGYWMCSCPGAINRGTCRHLTRIYPRSPTRAEKEQEVARDERKEAVRDVLRDPQAKPREPANQQFAKDLRAAMQNAAREMARLGTALSAGPVGIPPEERPVVASYRVVRSGRLGGYFVNAGDTVTLSAEDTDEWRRSITRAITNGMLKMDDGTVIAGPRRAPAPQPSAPAGPLARRIRREDEV